MNPHNFFAELKRRNVYKVAVAYAVVAWLLIQIATQVFPVFEIPGWAAPLVVILLLLGFPVALILAWAYELTPEGLKRTEEVAPHESITRTTGRKLDFLIIGVLLVVIALLITDRYRRPPASASGIPEKSIAVLPFQNLSKDEENSYFVDGLTEEILNRLAQIKELKVPGRTSSFAFKEQKSDLRQIGAALAVEHVLEGSVRKSADRIRITAQLVQTRDGYYLWSQSYDRKLDDVFAIQEEIARAIAAALSIQLKLSVSNKSERPTQDMAAYGNYLEARALIARRNTENLRHAISLLEAAVQRDPGFAKAWAALAQARALGFYYLVAPMKESLEGGESAARKALTIDDSLGAAHSALADVLRDRYEWLGAEAEYRRTLDLNPGEAETHIQYAQMLLRVAHLDEALEHANRACELDPLASVPPSIAALVQLARGDLSQSRTAWLDRFEKAAWAQAGTMRIRLELIHALSRHDAAEARRTLAMARSSSAAELSSPADRKLIEAMDQALASPPNEPPPAQSLSRALADARMLGESHVAVELAIVAAFLNQPEVALDSLSSEIRSDGVDVAWIWSAPPFRPLLKEPRFLELLRAMKLPEYWRVAGWPTVCHPKGKDEFECGAP